MNLMVLLTLMWHFIIWSLLSFGGNTVALTDVYRFAVSSKHWITNEQFVTFFSISQALPGPNGMALVLIGQQTAGLLGAFTALIAKLVPSSVLVYLGNAWYEKNSSRSSVKLFKSALIPVTTGLILAATFVLAKQIDIKLSRILLSICTAVIIYRYKINPIKLILGGVLLGIISVLTKIYIF